GKRRGTSHFLSCCAHDRGLRWIPPRPSARGGGLGGGVLSRPAAGIVRRFPADDLSDRAANCRGKIAPNPVTRRLPAGKRGWKLTTAGTSCGAPVIAPAPTRCKRGSDNVQLSLWRLWPDLAELAADLQAYPRGPRGPACALRHPRRWQSYHQSVAIR